MPKPTKPISPCLFFNSSPEIIWLVVMMYVRFPLSLRNVEDLMAERGIDICHETVRHWWNRFSPLFAADARRQRVSRMSGFRQWRWCLHEVYVKINGEMCENPKAVWQLWAQLDVRFGDRERLSLGLIRTNGGGTICGSAQPKPAPPYPEIAALGGLRKLPCRIFAPDRS